MRFVQIVSSENSSVLKPWHNGHEKFPNAEREEQLFAENTSFNSFAVPPAPSVV